MRGKPKTTIPQPKVNLYDAIQAGYEQDTNKRRSALTKNGYVYDDQISNGNNAVYFNPTSKKLLMTVKGTNPSSLRDIGTDAFLAMGKLQDTDRFKESDAILKKSKAKYNTQTATLAGHSLGGSVSQYLSGNNKVYTLDKGATIGQPTRSNEKAYRSSGDVVSAFGSGIKNIDNQNILQRNAGSILGGVIGGGFGLAAGAVADILRNHDVKNVKDKNIFIE